MMGALGASLAVWLSQAPTRDECFDAHERVQQLEGAGALIEARRHALLCAAPACPAAVRDDCAVFHQRLEKNVPEVLISLIDGAEPAAGQVSFDGGPLAAVSMRPTPVDPGEHTVTAQLADGRSQSRSFVARQGDKAARVELVFSARAQAPAEPAAPVPGTSKPAAPPVASWALGGLGLASLATFGVLGGYGYSREQALRACAPACDPALKAPLQATYLAADVALAIGAAALATALLVFLVTR